ncbi:non-specific lipid transfer protein GPI-anchored 5-like [Impatiens glandulifera]|uniref:non-specific lipid transfer protein GPI-anchored 5-like n=1 Tax=Impatiens glandulifera TaxID=253017 RepID=UPI001FB08B3C|nr:non-specific lipid transfer protein GPI-anchored 5-like [Impatiens glandulifera]
MAFPRTEMSFAIALLAMFCIGGAMAQTSSACTSVLISLSPCLNYLSGNSSTPSSSCCSQLANVVRSQPQCLCEALNGGGSSGLNIDRTRAVALPTSCNVQTPPLSRCNAGSPSKSPTGAPETPSDSGSKTIPTTDSGSSDASSSKIATSMIFFALFIAYSTISLV